MPIRPKKIFDRDGWLCALCAGVFSQGELVPHHRVNRGMGGNPSADKPSNILSLCSLCNGLIEADSVSAKKAHVWGIKLHSFDLRATHLMPVFFPVGGYRQWVVLDDEYGTAKATKEHSLQKQIMENRNGLG